MDEKVIPEQWSWCGNEYYKCSCYANIKRGDLYCNTCGGTLDWDEMKIADPIPGDLGAVFMGGKG